MLTSPKNALRSPQNAALTSPKNASLNSSLASPKNNTGSTSKLRSPSVQEPLSPKSLYVPRSTIAFDAKRKSTAVSLKSTHAIHHHPDAADSFDFENKNAPIVIGGSVVSYRFLCTAYFRFDFCFRYRDQYDPSFYTPEALSLRKKLKGDVFVKASIQRVFPPPLFCFFASFIILSRDHPGSFGAYSTRTTSDVSLLPPT